MVEPVGVNDNFYISEPVIMPMTEELRKQFDSVDWSKIPLMEEWKGD